MRSYGEQGLSDLVELTGFHLTMLSEVRYLHNLVFRIFSEAYYTTEEVAAFKRRRYGGDYAQVLTNHNLRTAWIDEQLVGTSTWCPVDDRGDTARICEILVHPLFTRAGIGTLLLRGAETQIRKAGFSRITLRAPIHMTAFFSGRGYETLSHGTCAIAPDMKVRVTFMRKQEMRKYEAGAGRTPTPTPAQPNAECRTRRDNRCPGEYRVVGAGIELSLARIGRRP